MSNVRHASFCQNCRCKTIPQWHEPSHCLFSALTLSLIAAGAVAPITGILLVAVWFHRVTSTGRWACPHCNGNATATI